MTFYTCIVYGAAVVLWMWSIHREGGIGVGARFIYVFTLAHQFLIGPPLYELSGLAVSDFRFANRAPAVELALYCMIAFVIGGYVLPPILLGYRLNLRIAWRPFMDPLRIRAQWQAAKLNVLIGCLSLPLVPVMFSIATVRGVWGQIAFLVETGLVMMCINAVLSNNQEKKLLAFFALIGTGLVKAFTSGFLYGTMQTGMLMAALIFMSRGISIKSWVYLFLIMYSALVPYSIWMSARSALREAIEGGQSIAERTTLFAREVKPIENFDFILDKGNVGVIAQRIDYSLYLKMAMEHTPAKEPYAYGATFQEGFEAMLPRILFPNKRYQAGNNDLLRFAGMKSSSLTNVSIGVNYLYEFYVNFGPIGAVAGMFVIGLCLGLMDYKYFERASRNIGIECMMIMSMWTISQTDKFAQLAMTLPVTALVGWGVGYFYEAFRLAPVHLPPLEVQRPRKVSIGSEVISS